MLETMKQIDDTFVSHIDNILNHEHGRELEAKQPKENGPLLSERSPTNNNVSFAKAREVAVDDEIPELVKVALSMDWPKNELHMEREYKLWLSSPCGLTMERDLLSIQGFASADSERDAKAIRIFLEDENPIGCAQSYAENTGLYGQRVGCMR
ncbi:hypothetical protein AAC387_Pa04g1404 [Persea americana]